MLRMRHQDDQRGLTGGGSYLNDGVAEYRGRHIADPHAQYHGNKHVGDQHCPRPGTCFAQDESGDLFGDVVLGKGCCNRKASKQQHDHRGPHGGEDIFCCLWWS